MDESLQNYFLSQVQPQPTPIHVLLGLRDQTLSKIPVEHFVTASGNQLVQSWMAQHIAFYKGGLTDQIIIAGHVGINEELFDQVYPSFMVHHQELNILENLFQTNPRKLQEKLLMTNISSTKKENDSTENSMMNWNKASPLSLWVPNETHLKPDRGPKLDQSEPQKGLKSDQSDL